MENKYYKILGTILGIMSVVMLTLGGYFIYTEFIKKDNSKEINKLTPTATPVPTANNQYKNEFKLPAEFDKQTTINDKILLGNIERNIQIDPEIASIKIDNKLIYQVEDYHLSSFSAVYVINNEVLMIVQVGSYIDSTSLIFFDKDLNKIDVDLTLGEFKYPEEIRIESGATMENNVLTHYDGIKVDGKKIIISGSRLLNLEDKLCAEDPTTYKNTFVGNEYKGQVFRAEYEIEYLGNNKFSKSKEIKVLQTIDESLCK